MVVVPSMSDSVYACVTYNEVCCAVQYSSQFLSLYKQMITSITNTQVKKITDLLSAA